MTATPLSPKEQEAADNLVSLLEEYPQLKAAKTPFQKRMAVRPILKQLRSKMAESEKEVEHLNEKKAFCEPLLHVKEQYEEWRALPLTLEKNDCSRLHQLVGYLKLQHKYMAEIVKGMNPNEFPWGDVTPFVVEHDWAGAFKNATDYNEGSFNLPYELCAFEFRISGRSVTALAAQTSDEVEPAYTFYVGFKDYWLSFGPDDVEIPETPPFAFAVSQIKALCVAMDAEVATRRMVRVADKVNRKREKEGREPFYSYHIIDLNRRYRVANPSHGGGVSQGKKRLHFRRGHYRHYAEFKTWVRWTLVGNPELGFIDKEYRL